MNVLHTKEDIKDCPFCGGHAQAYQSDKRVAGHNEFDDSVGIICTECEVKVEAHDYAGRSVNARLGVVIIKWNTRVN